MRLARVDPTERLVLQTRKTHAQYLSFSWASGSLLTVFPSSMGIMMEAGRYARSHDLPHTAYRKSARLDTNDGLAFSESRWDT